MDYLLVGLVGLVGGGFAIPVGFALGLAPIGIYLAGTVGSLAGMVAVLFGGDRLRRWIAPSRGASDDGESAASQARRRGPVWLGLIGPTFPGVTATAVLGLASGMERDVLARWMAVGIGALYAVYTIGLWLIGA